LKIFGKLLTVCILTGGLIPSVALAVFPAGQWTMMSYSEVGLGPATHGICFQIGETQNKGTWYSDTATGWSGKWFRRGNDIHLQGNYTGGAGNSAFELTYINYKLLTGYWQDWKDDNLFNNYSRVQFTFQKESCNPSR